MRRFAALRSKPRPRALAAPACPRQALAAVIDASPYSYASLSRMIDRRPGFLRCFVTDGHPAALAERDHRLLADFFGVPPRALGVRELWTKMERVA